MARHLLFLGKSFSFPVLFLFFFCGTDVISKQSATNSFKKISFAPRTNRQSHVKDPFLSAFESRDDFLGRGDESQRSREIVGCAQGKGTQRNATIDETKSNFCDRAIPTGGEYQVCRLGESFLETGFFRGLVSGV